MPHKHDEQLYAKFFPHVKHLNEFRQTLENIFKNVLLKCKYLKIFGELIFYILPVSRVSARRLAKCIIKFYLQKMIHIMRISVQ